MTTKDRVQSRLQRITAAIPSREAGSSNCAEDGPADGRQARRKTTLVLGLIICQASGRTIKCTVLDMSATGAKVKLNLAPQKPFDPPRQLPQTFRLVLTADDQEVDGELAWSTTDNIGVRFTSAFRPARIPSIPRM